MGLGKYKQKRNFKETKEPGANKDKLNKTAKKNIFVVQEHHARNLHYDFRLQSEGVLKSWAVPKGIPKADEKRLAIMVEDHPLEYAKFHGTIPKGNYGAGTVEIWDKGKYENLKENRKSIAGDIKKGHITIRLLGRKLKGNYALNRLKDGKNWIFIKMKNA